MLSYGEPILYRRDDDEKSCCCLARTTLMRRARTSSASMRPKSSCQALCLSMSMSRRFHFLLDPPLHLSSKRWWRFRPGVRFLPPFPPQASRFLRRLLRHRFFMDFSFLVFVLESYSKRFSYHSFLFYKLQL